eukprot:scaffold2062_cov273-Chaetoceros_neogracile.AAC.40
MMIDLTSYAPVKSRKMWTWINAICLVWSLLLLAGLLFTFGPLERLQGTHAYLSWTVVTTIVWVVEVGLTMFEMQQGNLNKDVFKFLYFQTWKDFEVFMELLAALYFLADSTKVFWLWQKADPDVDGQMLDALLCSMAYCYQVVALRDHQTDHSSDYIDIDESHIDENSTTSSAVVVVAHQTQIV